MGNESKEGWFKRHPMLSAVLIVIGLLILGNIFFGNEEKLSTTQTGIQESSLSQSQAQKNDDSPCRPVIPERLKLECDRPESYGNQIICSYPHQKDTAFPAMDYYWADGSLMSDSSNLVFFQGGEIGENVNYVYMRSKIIVYKKKNISPDGTVNKPTIYDISLAVNPVDKTEEGYKIVLYRCGGTGMDPYDVDSRNKWRPM